MRTVIVAPRGALTKSAYHILRPATIYRCMRPVVEGAINTVNQEASKLKSNLSPLASRKPFSNASTRSRETACHDQASNESSVDQK